MKRLAVPVIARVIQTALLVVAANGAQVAFAQEFPSRPVRIVVTSPVGSTQAVLARAVGAKLGERWKHPVIVDVRVGAGGNIAYEYVAKSPPDGYILVLAGNSLLTNPSLYRNLPYDVQKDFVGITWVATSQNVLLVHPSVEARTVVELIALAKKNPGELIVGSAGSGTPLHLTGEMFKLVTGVQMMHVPYKGSSFAANDLLGGRIQLMFSGIVSFVPHLKAGKLRALAVTGAMRSPLMPDVPTFTEAGLSGFDIETWFGLYGPAAIPAGIVSRLNSEFAAIMADADLNARLNALGMTFPARYRSPEEFAGVVRAENVKMAELVRASGAKVD